MTPPIGTDFEDRLATLMREQADLRLGPAKQAPTFQPDAPETTSDSSRVRRLLPLIAALVVVVLGVGIFLLVATSRRATIPADPVPDGRQQVLDARIALPEGWLVRPSTDFDTTYYIGSEDHTFCLMPKSAAGTKDWLQCPVWIGHFDDGELAALALPDAPVILFQDIAYCPKTNPQEAPLPGVQIGQRQFGGREAEWRSFTFRCSRTETTYFENYVVETGPDWIMSTMQNSDEARKAMAYVAANSQLPAQTTKLRYYDQGIVTSVGARGDLTRITIDRVYGGESLGRTVRSKVSVSYDVHTALYTQALQGTPVKVGDRLRIDTNGTTVLNLVLGAQ